MVDEHGEAVAGANVYIEGTFDGASSDWNGDFSFETAGGKQIHLMASFLGYKTWQQTILIDTTEFSINIQLQPAPQSFETVTITAGAFEASDEKKSVVLRPLDIVTTAGATADIAGALNTLPGTQIVGETGKLFVRGGDAYETRTFIDGLYVLKPYNSTIPTLPARNRFSPFLFKGTTFTTGGYSAEYGQALSSALILETQDVAEENLTSVSLMTIGASLGKTKVWDNTSLALEVGHTDLGIYTRVVPQNIRWNVAPRDNSAQLVFRHKPGTSSIFKLQASLNAGQFSLENPDVSNVLKSNILNLRNTNFFLNSTYRQIWDNGWSLHAGMAYSADAEHISELFQLDNLNKGLQTRFTLSKPLSRFVKLKTGVAFLAQQFREEYRTPDGQDFPTQWKEELTAAFLEADWSLGSRWALRTGLRAEQSGLLNQGSLGPRVSVACKTSSHAQWSIAFGQFFQNPDEVWFRYNKQLQLEKATHYILNYQVNKNDRTLRAEAYYKSYSRLARSPWQAPWLSDNSGYGYAKGIDIFFRDRKSIRYGDYWISYGFLDTKRFYQDFPTSAAPRFASRHNVSVVYKHWLNAIHTSAGLTLSYASPRSFDDPNTPDFNDGRTSPYRDLSFNASYLTSLFGHFTIVYFSATNLPGFKNTYGSRFSQTPNDEGVFTSTVIQMPAPRFVFLGMFVSIGQKLDLSNID